MLTTALRALTCIVLLLVLSLGIMLITVIFVDNGRDQGDVAFAATGTITKAEFKKLKIGMCRWQVRKITKASGDIVSIAFFPGVKSELRKYHGPSKGSVVYLGQTKKGKACWKLSFKQANHW